MESPRTNVGARSAVGGDEFPVEDIAQTRDPMISPKWRDSLDEIDKAAVMGWARQAGLERTARLIAKLAEDGEKRRLPQWQIVCLLQLFHLNFLTPDRPICALAQEVARATVQPRIRRIPVAKLEAQLERLFREKRSVWRFFTHSKLLPAVNEIVGKLGVERVARIVIALTKRDGKRGPTPELQTRTLTKIAQIRRQQPGRTGHNVVLELQTRSPHARSPDPSFVTRVLRDYRRTRHIWTSLSASKRPSSRFDRHGKTRSIAERCATQRIVELLPTAIDLYDMLISDLRVNSENNARKLNARMALIRLARRERIEKWLTEAAERQHHDPYVRRAWGIPIIPRSLFALIFWDFHQFLKTRRRPTRDAQSGLNRPIKSNDLSAVPI
jgi:hypothetical protein